MPILQNSSNVFITGGEFTSITKTSQKGIELLLKHIAIGAFHNSAERYDPPKCHPNTRVAVVQDIIDWIEDGQKTTFVKWLYGAAGAGKSAIAQEIAELCHQSGRLAASFFWSRSAAGRNNEERLITSLAYQLLIAIPRLRSYVEEVVETDPSIFTRSLAAQMDSLVIGPLERAFNRDQGEPVDYENPKVIILDGLDECGKPEAQEYILETISQSVHRFPIPLVFLVASRPELAIRESFNDQSLLNITSRLALDEKYSPDDDIMLFLVDSFESLKRTHTLRSLLPPVWPTEDNIRQLVRKSSGQFIYAATVVKFVGSPRRKLDEQLNIVLGITAAGKDIPFSELDALYSHIFSLVEDIPKVLEALSCLFLVYKSGENFAYALRRLLGYSLGELQLVLIDLHSVLNVPGIGDDEGDEDFCSERLYTLHASLQDFLMDPARSGKFYIDKGVAHANLARHYLRYLEGLDPSQEYWDLFEIKAQSISYLLDHCSESSTTKELLEDFFDFDFEKWVRPELKGGNLLYHYCEMVDLYLWCQQQESNVQKYFGPGRSLSTHHATSFEAALNVICRGICREIVEAFPEAGCTAMTHPRILHYYDDKSERLKVVGNIMIFPDFTVGDTHLDPLKNYLRDPERSGEYYVNGGMYAAMCLRIFRFIFASKACTYSDEDDGSPKSENHAGESYGSQNDLESVKFAIAVLPFYLSNADYTLELCNYATNMLDHKYFALEDEVQWEIKPLHEAIELYLAKKPHAPTTMFPANSEHFKADKRHRNTDENLEVIGSTMPQTSLSVLPLSKRLRITGVANPLTESP